MLVPRPLPPLLLLAAILLAAPAVAQPLPAFDAKLHVQTMPSGYVPPSFGEAGLMRLESELARIRQPFYVVLAEELPGSGDADGRAQALTDSLAAAWAKDGFDPGTSFVFALSFEPRKYSLLAGARWRTDLGLEGVALDPYLERFLARVRDTPVDPIGGIIDMAKALDEHVFDRTDPERVAARAKVEAQQALAAARDRLREQVKYGERLLADGEHRPADVSQYLTSLALAKKLVDSDDEGAITREAMALDRELDPLAAAIAESRRAAAERAMWLKVGFVIAGLLLVFAVIFFFIRKGQLGRRRKAFAALAKVWNERITNAAGRYVEFYGKRDGILGLLELEGKTKALLEQVTGEVDAIYSSVAAMEAHVKEVTEDAEAARWFTLKPIDEALKKFEAPFEFDTGVLNEADLFGPPTKHLRIEPQQLPDQLEQRFAGSLAGWKRLETAADLRFHDAAALLPQSLLDEALERAAAQRVPARWLADHPLYGDDAADRALWETADAWRWKDAVAYLDAIEEQRARHEAVMARLARLVAVREQVAAVRLEAIAAFASPTRYDAADDPAATLERAKNAAAELEGRILAAEDLEAVEASAKATVTLYRSAAAQTLAIETALRQAAPAIDSAGRLEATAREQLAAARERAELATHIHADSRVESFVSEAQRGLDGAALGLALARVKLGERRHLDAQRAAEQAQVGFTEARADAEDGSAHFDSLEAVRAAYEQRVAGLDELRRHKAAELVRYNSSRTLESWQPVAPSGPVVYGELVRELDSVVERWNAVVRSARHDWEEAERRRRAAEEEARRAAAAAVAHVVSSALSWSSSSSSRSSFSSSFSSSSRSSSSSGSWGGGRSSSRSGSW